jgi:TolA-binding protein
MDHPETEEHARRCDVCRVERAASVAVKSAWNAEPDDAALTERLIEAAVVSRRARRATVRSRWIVLGVAAALLVASVAAGSIARELSRAKRSPVSDAPLTVVHPTSITPTQPNVEINRDPLPTSTGEAPPGPSVVSQGNQQRASGDAEKAIATYKRLVSSFPTSAEAATARLSLGRMLLDRGDAQLALTQYDAYVASNDPTLREEALAGRARALERLGQRTEEKQAWQKLLREFPSTLFADKARSRLE